MRIIAIDPGTHTGWATSECATAHGVEDISPRKPKAPTKRNPAGVSGEPDDERWVKLWTLLDRLSGIDMAAHEAMQTLLCHEAPLSHHVGVRAAQLAFGAQTALALWARNRGARRIEVTPLDLQRFVLGRRATPKTYEMMAAAKERLGYQGNDHNIADALWLLEWAKIHAAK